MKRKLRTLAIMEGVDLFFIGLMINIISIFFPTILEIKLVEIAMLVLMLVGVGCIWFGYIYSIIHCCKNEELTSNQRALNLVLIILLSMFYIPIYYTKHVIKEKTWWGILNCVLYAIFYLLFIVGLIAGTFFNIFLNTIDESTEKNMLVNTKDNRLSLELSNNFTCKTEEIGDYQLYCSNDYKDEVIGIFNYDNTFDNEYILKFHTNQLIDSYKEIEYEVINDSKNNLLRKVELSKNNSNQYIIVEVKEFNNSLKSVLVYYGAEDEYEEIFSSVKYKTINTSDEL